MTDERWDIPDDERAVWEALDGVAPKPIPSDASARIERALGATLVGLWARGGPVRSRKTLAAALVLVMAGGGAAGFGIGVAHARSATAAAADGAHGPAAAATPSATGAPSRATGAPEQQRYLLLVHDNEAIDRAVQELGLATVVDRYATWARGLAEQGRLLGAEQLTPAAQWIGPAAPASSSVSGYFLIRATSEAEAVALARRSPHAELGGVVEVRGIVRGPPPAPPASTPEDEPAPPDTQVSPVETLGWMAGCWVDESGPSRVEELWTAPGGGVMLGASRTVRDGALRSFEHLLLQARGDGAIYRASPSGQATTEFASIHLSDTLVVFENPEHDFPRRISYRRVSGDSLRARVEGPGADGSATGFVIRYGRSGCPG